mmetsp:Transcript_80775/g.164496  ORF Transcript_80775/g.164496 Transcript_80775/m.164496 type:complete len:122 (-) Transcript_80775:29-394(-)
MARPPRAAGLQTGGGMGCCKLLAWSNSRSVKLLDLGVLGSDASVTHLKRQKSRPDDPPAPELPETDAAKQARLPNHIDHLCPCCPGKVHQALRDHHRLGAGMRAGQSLHGQAQESCALHCT